MDSNRTIAALKRSRHQCDDVRAACVKDRTVEDRLVAVLIVVVSIQNPFLSLSELYEKRRYLSKQPTLVGETQFVAVDRTARCWRCYAVMIDDSRLVCCFVIVAEIALSHSAA
ncbi:hypothetical protein Trydic_g386 [Trypoxylus dichotomus]